MSNPPPLDDRIDTRVNSETKVAYQEHALKKHGLRKLGDWVRMLMHRDFTAKDE